MENTNSADTAQQRGLYEKFKVLHPTGQPVVGPTFVLRPHDEHAVAALTTYANSVEAENPILSKEMRVRFGLPQPPKQEPPNEPRLYPTLVLDFDNGPLTHWQPLHAFVEHPDGTMSLVPPDSLPTTDEPLQCRLGPSVLRWLRDSHAETDPDGIRETDAEFLRRLASDVGPTRHENLDAWRFRLRQIANSLEVEASQSPATD